MGDVLGNAGKGKGRVGFNSYEFPDLTRVPPLTIMTGSHHLTRYCILLNPSHLY